MNTKERSSNIELLRIISILMIIACHFATHGGFQFVTGEVTVPRLWWGVLEMGGNFGVDVFVLISGYFLITTEKLNVTKTVRLWGQIFFYSVLMFVAAFLLGRGDVSIKSIIKMLLPITFEQWWFASTYFVLFLVHPWINRFLRSLTKAQYQRVLLALLFMWSIIPTFTTSSFQSNPLIEFVFYYSIAGYIRLYGLAPSVSGKTWLGIWFGAFIVKYLSYAGFLVLSKWSTLASKATLIFFGRQSVFTIISAVALFMYFRSMIIKNSKFINTVAAATFGVYLIHDSNLLRPYLWLEVFKNYTYQNTPMIIPYSIWATLLVFAVCTVIELVRKRLIEDQCTAMFKKHAKKICAVCGRVESAVIGKLFS